MEATTQEEYSHCSDSEEDCDAGLLEELVEVVAPVIPEHHSSTIDEPDRALTTSPAVESPTAVESPPAIESLEESHAINSFQWSTIWNCELSLAF